MTYFSTYRSNVAQHGLTDFRYTLRLHLPGYRRMLFSYQPLLLQVEESELGESDI